MLDIYNKSPLHTTNRKNVMFYKSIFYEFDQNLFRSTFLIRYFGVQNICLYFSIKHHAQENGLENMVIGIENGSKKCVPE